jgi:hypothetical protein
VSAEEASCAFVFVNVSHGCHDAEPGAGVFCELGIAGLEEDLDAVEGRDYCFCLSMLSVLVTR